MKKYLLFILLFISATDSYAQCDYICDCIEIELPTPVQKNVCSGNSDATADDIDCSFAPGDCIFDLDDFIVGTLHPGTWTQISGSPSISWNFQNQFSLYGLEGLYEFTYTVECHGCTFEETYKLNVAPVYDHVQLNYCSDQDENIDLANELPSDYDLSNYDPALWTPLCSSNGFADFGNFNPSQVTPGYYSWLITLDDSLFDDEYCPGSCSFYVVAKVSAAPIVNLPDTVFICGKNCGGGGSGTNLNTFLEAGSNTTGSWSKIFDCNNDVQTNLCPTFTLTGGMTYSSIGFVQECLDKVFYSVTSNGCTTCEEMYIQNIPAPPEIPQDTFCNSPGSILIVGGIGSGAMLEVDNPSDYQVTGVPNPFDPSTLPLGANIAYITRIFYEGNSIDYICSFAGCTEQTAFIIEDCCGGVVIDVQANIITDEYCQLSDGAIDIDVSGGSQPYIFDWSNGAQTEDITGLENGTYTVTVTDQDDCQVIQSFTINLDPGNIDADVTFDNISCADPDGYIYVNSVSNANLPITITVFHVPNICPFQQITTSSFPQTFTVTCTGEYTVTFEDQDGCLYTETLEINDESGCCDPIVIDATIVHPTCGQNDGEILLSVSGGVPGYTYDWLPTGLVGNNQVGIPAGDYYVTVTDQEGCTETGQYELVDDNSGCCTPEFEIEMVIDDLSLGNNCNLQYNSPINMTCNECCSDGAASFTITKTLKLGSTILATVTTSWSGAVPCINYGQTGGISPDNPCILNPGDIVTYEQTISNITNLSGCDMVVVNSTVSGNLPPLTQGWIDGCDCCEECTYTLEAEDLITGGDIMYYSECEPSSSFSLYGLNTIVHDLTVFKSKIKYTVYEDCGDGPSLYETWNEEKVEVDGQGSNFKSIGSNTWSSGFTINDIGLCSNNGSTVNIDLSNAVYDGSDLNQFFLDLEAEVIVQMGNAGYTLGTDYYVYATISNSTKQLNFPYACNDDWFVFNSDDCDIQSNCSSCPSIVCGTTCDSNVGGLDDGELGTNYISPCGTLTFSMIATGDCGINSTPCPYDLGDIIPLTITNGLFNPQHNVSCTTTCP